MELNAVITTVSTTLAGKEGAQSLVTTIKLEARILPEQIRELATLQRAGWPVAVEIIARQPAMMRE